MKFKKGIITIIFSLMVALVITACSNPSNDDDKSSGNNTKNNATGNVLWEKTSNGMKEKVVLSEITEDGIKTKTLAYSILEEKSNKGLGFCILQMESNDNRIYKGLIVAKKPTEAFENLFWNQYRISCGQSTITMSNAISGPDKEDEDYEFIIMGGLSENQVTALKNANELVISLSNFENPSRNISFSCNINFILNLIKYF